MLLDFHDHCDLFPLKLDLYLLTFKLNLVSPFNTRLETTYQVKITIQSKDPH